MRVLVAGMGNLLRGDDGFGVAVVQRLAAGHVPPGVVVREIGIGGIHLVQDLLDPVDALIVADAVAVPRPPGTVVVIRPEPRDVHAMSPQQRHDALADVHYATPERALMLARGLGVLPTTTWVVGCRPEDTDSLRDTLSPAVAAAVGPAAAEIRRLVTELGVDWPA